MSMEMVCRCLELRLLYVISNLLFVVARAEVENVVDKQLKKELINILRKTNEELKSIEEAFRELSTELNTIVKPLEELQQPAG